MNFKTNSNSAYARLIASALALAIGGCGGSSGSNGSNGSNGSGGSSALQTAGSGEAAPAVVPASTAPAQTTSVPLVTATRQAPTTPIPPLSTNPTQLIFGGTVGAPGFWPDGDTATGADGTRPVDGIDCSDSEAYHIHAHLSIIREGLVQAVPANIGILAKCIYEIHTHDKTGEIHLEAPIAKRFTLGNFFAVWGQPLSRSNIAGITGAAVTVYVTDGATTVEYTGDLAQLELTSHRLVTIQIGKPIQAIPTVIWDTPG